MIVFEVQWLSFLSTIIPWQQTLIKATRWQPIVASAPALSLSLSFYVLPEVVHLEP